MAGAPRKRGRQCPLLHVLVPNGLPWVCSSTLAHHGQEHRGQNVCLDDALGVECHIEEKMRKEIRVRLASEDQNLTA